MRQPGAVRCPSHVSWQHSSVPAVDWTCPTTSPALQGHRANGSNSSYHLLNVPAVLMLHTYNFTRTCLQRASRAPSLLQGHAGVYTVYMYVYIQCICMYIYIIFHKKRTQGLER